jgi:D-alanyl-D-alanine carboxypeptidase/D-alanyl-D-alanine-endopeptidase (penicillin-binding protein 4)
VAEAGVRTVTGDLVGDDSFLENRPYGSGWEAGDRDFAFGADVSALTLHDNMVDLRAYPAAPGAPCFLFPMPGLGLLPLRNRTRTGEGAGLRATWRGEVLDVEGALPPGSAPATLAVPLREPARFAAALFRRALERRGIRILGGIRVRHAGESGPEAQAELAFVLSPPLREVVRATLKDSVNLYAQLLLLRAGGSEEAGLKRLSAFLASLGIPGGVVLEEGSGLSRKNLVTPEAMTALLAAMARRPEGEAFREALPVAGLDGTLRNRMADTAAAFRVQAKTGTLRFDHALAGYATTPAGERLAFAVILNNDTQPGSREAVDAIPVLLAGGMR